MLGRAEGRWEAAGPAPGPLWHDEFDGPAGAAPDPENWTAETGGEWGDNELQQYTDRTENAQTDGEGHLVITADRETYTGDDGVTRDYTSARLTTYKKFDFQYGHVEARMKVPRGKGLVAAFWTLGSDIEEVGWPECGEFDVVEVVGEKPSIAHGSLHGPGVGEHGWAQTEEYLNDGAAVARLARVRGDLDARVHRVLGRRPGVLAAHARGAAGRRPLDLRPAHAPLLTLSVGGPWAGAPDESTEWPARLLVDWIRVWPS